VRVLAELAAMDRASPSLPVYPGSLGLAPRAGIGAKGGGYRAVSNGIWTSAAFRAIRTNPASHAALSARIHANDSLVVVQAVAGSSPVAHPPPEGPHLRVFAVRLSEWREALTSAQAACTSELGADLGANAGSPVRSGSSDSAAGDVPSRSLTRSRYSSRRFRLSSCCR
jgi:hypothetical protein